MTPAKSKPSAPAARLHWAWAYAGAALLLALSLGLAWWQESHRPWQTEVRAINQTRGRLLTQRLIAAGLDPSQARAAGAAEAAAPPSIIEITPQAFGQPERCLTCHQGIEAISPSHPVEAVGCVVCHGGQGLGLSKSQAHQGLRGRNPSDLGQARESCGGAGQAAQRCHGQREEEHANLVTRVERTIMATMTGVITSLRLAWGAQDDFLARLATAAAQDPQRPTPPPPGTLAQLAALPDEPPRGNGPAALAEEHWRKFCARCHLRAQRDQGHSAHGQGCAACHGQRAPDGRYQGQDAAIPRQEPGHARVHQLWSSPPEDNCRACHNRSGRIGLNYQGGMEDEGGRVPWAQAQPREDLSGGRSLRRLLPDVHAEKGLSCIDCHSAREIMGDGRLYGRMRQQTEVRCQTCHGGADGPPSLGPADAETRFEVASGPLKQAPPLEPGARLALSAKGRPLANLRQGAKGLTLLARSRPGQEHLSPSIASDPRHNLPGHRRLSCQACHSRWTPQCFGCHDQRGALGGMWDYAAQGQTPGTWRETRDLYRFLTPVLGVDSQGMIRPFAPGCQVLLSEQGEDGQPLPDRQRQIARGGAVGNGIVSTPISPHTTRREVRPCEDCHMNPQALGLGDGPRLLRRLAPQPLADLAQAGWPADWSALSDGQAQPLMGSTHQGARPLDRREIARVLRFARCLPCHRQPADPVLKDPRQAYARIAPGGDHYLKHQAQVERALR
ncbi:MAG: hypothetical protein V1806_02595 [Pseudomonadota bacterium]